MGWWWWWSNTGWTRRALRTDHPHHHEVCWDTGTGGGGGGDARADAAADDDDSDDANGTTTPRSRGGEEATIAWWGNGLLGALPADTGDLDDEEEDGGEAGAGCSVLVVQARHRPSWSWRFWVVLGGSGWFWVVLGSGFWVLAPAQRATPTRQTFGGWPAALSSRTTAASSFLVAKRPEAPRSAQKRPEARRSILTRHAAIIILSSGRHRPFSTSQTSSARFLSVPLVGRSTPQHLPRSAAAAGPAPDTFMDAAALEEWLRAKFGQ